MANTDSPTGILTTLKTIADNQLGNGHIQRKLFYKSLQPNSPYFVVAGYPTNTDDHQLETQISPNPPNVQGTITDQPDTPPVAFCIGAIFDKKQFDNYLQIPRSNYPTNLQNAYRVGVIQTIAVAESHHDYGYEETTFNECVNVFSADNTPLLLGIGRETDDGFLHESVFSSAGFTKERIIPDYWAEESLKQNYHCDSCGIPPCTCRAALFTNQTR